jgi:hypothetical protein
MKLIQHHGQLAVLGRNTAVYLMVRKHRRQWAYDRLVQIRTNRRQMLISGLYLTICANFGKLYMLAGVLAYCFQRFARKLYPFGLVARVLEYGRR